VNLDADDSVAALAVIGQKDLEPRVEETDDDNAPPSRAALVAELAAEIVFDADAVAADDDDIVPESAD
jgi:hypothetical protein